MLAPTRELALQVCEAFESYAAHMKGVHLLPVYGGQGYGVQLSALRRGVHIVVGTPGRIMDHLEKGTLDLSELKYLVLDEADEMLKMGFAEDVETILADTPDDKQVALFSATMPAQIRRISQAVPARPRRDHGQDEDHDLGATRRQRYLVVSYPQKVDALTRILEVENFEAMIVFVRTKNETETLAEKLRARGYSAAAINGDVAQAQRERTVDQLKSGKLDILVATDVAARGLDVERISHVVNYDMPIDTESYVHRIGRTGRAGRSRRGDQLRHAARAPHAHLHRARHAPAAARRCSCRPPRTSTRRGSPASTTRSPRRSSRTSRIARFRDIIGHYVEHHDVPEADVAAALAVVAQGETPLLLIARGRPSAALAFDRERPRPAATRRSAPSAAPRPSGTARPPTGSRSAGGSGSSRARSSARSRTRAACSREDFGGIDIRPDFSLIELPVDLSGDVLDKLSGTRISGKLIQLRADGGPLRKCSAEGAAHRPRRYLMRGRRTTAARRSGLLRSAITIVLGLSRRRDVAPARVPWRDRAAASYEAPMPAANPLQFGRAYQLPPFGRGNGLEALFWTPSERLPAERVDAVLESFRERDIAAWAAPARLPQVDRRSAAAPHDLWVASARLDEAQDLVMRLLRSEP